MSKLLDICKKSAKLNRDRPVGEISQEKLNVNGGARLILTALKELKRRGSKRALISMCVGGGQGGAVWLER